MRSGSRADDATRHGPVSLGRPRGRGQGRSPGRPAAALRPGPEGGSDGRRWGRVRGTVAYWEHVLRGRLIFTCLFGSGLGPPAMLTVRTKSSHDIGSVQIGAPV